LLGVNVRNQYIFIHEDKYDHKKYFEEADWAEEDETQNAKATP
jgi:hypothetical protein